MSVSTSTLERLGGGALFDALRSAADRGKLGLALTFLDSDPPQMIFLNEYPRTMLGYTQSEVDRAGFWVFVAPEEVARLREYLAALARGKGAPPSFETVALSKAGKRIPIQLTLSEVEIDQRRAAVAFFADVSERWRAMSALQESEERFRLVVEGAPDGVAIVGEGRIRFLNPTAARLLGLPEPKAGQGRLLSDFLHPDDLALAGEGMHHVLLSGDQHDKPVEYRTRNADGHEIVLEVSTIPIEIGGEHAVLAFARDITERKAIQTRLAEAERLTALGVLSAGVAHEINNPLAYVLLNLEYLKRELPKLADRDPAVEQLLIRLSDACHGAERVAAIVRDLRIFARGDDSDQVPVELTRVMEAAIDIGGHALTRSARLVREYGDVPLVHGNPHRLEQVFLNLLLNAAQALPQGNPELDRIWIRMYRRDGHAVVEIEDTGEGISQALQARIFEPFFTTKPVGVGTGLGLPICRSIIATHGGSIDVESQVGRGTLFRVRLVGAR
ncbi:MAG TPA: PAS domain S-box protein [Polyangiaceae bacterium]|nr:PAS domain S-box protein [Polyangiaceae bacterium]